MPMFSHLSRPSTGKHLHHNTHKDGEKYKQYLLSLTHLCQHINKGGKKEKKCKWKWTRNNKTGDIISRWELTEGRIGNDVGLLFHSAPQKGVCGGDGWAHTSHTPQCWQLPLSQLNSDPSASFIWLHVWTHSRQVVRLYWQRKTLPHTLAHAWHVPARAKSHIYLALHIYTAHTHRHTEVFLWAKSPYSSFSQSSGPASGLIVCGGLGRTLWHWLMVGTFSVKMPHWPHSGTSITHTTSAHVPRLPMWVWLGFFLCL